MTRRLLYALLALVVSVLPTGLRGDAPGANAETVGAAGVPAAAPALPAPAPALLAAAHEPGQAYMFLRIHDDSIVVRLEMLHTHLDETLGLGWGEAPPTLPEIEAALDRILPYAAAHTRIAEGERTLELRFRGADSRFVDFGEFVMLEYLIEISPTPDLLDFTYTPFFETYAQHRNFQIVEYNWKTGTYNEETNITLVFTPRDPTQSLDLTRSTVWTGFVAMVWQGIWHIWIGLDHILFLVALVLPSVLVLRQKQWEPAVSFKSALLKIVTIVTFFTIAHSVTLSLAALDVVHLPSVFVETVIALSIAAAALHNLLPRFDVKEAAIAFAFGLFHGFGFATVLGDIGLGREYLVLTLLGFNVGVEIGQIAIIAALFPVLFLLRRSRLYPWLFRLGSFALVGIGLLWAAERTFGFNVPLGPIFRKLVSPVTGLFG